MFDLSWPGSYGQENDAPVPAVHPDPSLVPPVEPKAKRTRCNLLKLSETETKHVRVAVRKLRRAFGSFRALAAVIGIPSNTVRRIASPNSSPPTGTFAIRLAAALQIPVEALLAGKLVVSPGTIARVL